MSTVKDDKADFTDIYSAPDPRPYVTALEPLGYRMPQAALPLLQTVLGQARPEGTTRTLLDVCCSYGLMGALLRSKTPEQALERYADPSRAGLSSAELAAADHAEYAGARPDLRVLGLDRSQPAIDYGTSAGLLDAGWAQDLESNDPSASLGAALRAVDVIVCTGGVGYIGVPTFRRLLAGLDDPSQSWWVVYVLRVFDYGPIIDEFARHGLVTEKLPGTEAQRRFADEDEQAAALADVRRRGLDPAGKEDAGWFHAEGFLTRPAEAAARVPLADGGAMAGRDRSQR